MSRLNLISLVAIGAALCLYLIPGGPARPMPALAADCEPGETGTLIIEIIDISTDDTLPFAGAEVLVKPDPRDFLLDDIVVDTDLQDANTSQDKDSDAGTIRLEDVCSTEGSESYLATIWSLPGDLEDCSVESSDTAQLEPDATEQLTLEVDCTGVGPTPTITVTPTGGPAATVQASASPLSVGCSGTSVISIQVRDAAGHAVQTGTAVALTTTLGSLSPSSGLVTGSNGIVYTFFTAPATTGGTAVITATAGSASGSASVAVNCGATAGTPVPPPPTVGAGVGGVITPPNTGDGGLAGSARGELRFALVLLMISSIGLAGSLRVKRS